MSKIRLDPNPAQGALAFAQERGLHRLGAQKLAPLADEKGIVGLAELSRLVRVAGVDNDGTLSQEERQRIDAYLADRKNVVVGTANSSAVDVRAPVRTPVEGYIQVSHAVGPEGLTFDVDISLGFGAEPRQEHARRVLLPGLSPKERESSWAVTVQRYGVEGENASTGYQNQGLGAGYIVGVADPKLGAVLVNLSVASVLAKDKPDARTLFSPGELARREEVKAFAQKKGLDPAKLEVEVLEVSFHSDFKVEQDDGGDRVADTETHTLALTLELREAGSRKLARTAEFSALVEGNLTKPLRKLEVGAFEAGIGQSMGFTYPPSFLR
jgi:hypothetical protein